MRKSYWISLLCLAAAVGFSGCGAKGSGTAENVSVAQTGYGEGNRADLQKDGKQKSTGADRLTADQADRKTTIMVAAAASLEKCLTDQLIPLFEEQNPDIHVIGTYDSSGKLQTQIEEGADADVFFSASSKQMDGLMDEGLMDEDSIRSLLANKIVLIVPAGQEEVYREFTDITKAKRIAVGDPESVPAGQYAREALEKLGLWEELSGNFSLGTNVTEVLNWVAEGSADAGIVYATDAAQKPDQVAVAAEAPAGSVKNPVYPAGIVKASANQEAAGKFLDFLESEEAMEIFRENGFSAAD